jgi:hypothetical protein
MHVDCLQVVQTELHEHLWEIYAQSFHELRERSPVRQYFNRQEFGEALLGRHSRKFLLWDKGAVIGLGIATNDLDQVPWLNAHFYRTRFPEAVASKRLWYIEAVAIPKGLRGGRAALTLLRAMFEKWDELGDVGAFDFDSSNEALVRLLEMVGSRVARGGFSRLGSQHYWAFTKKV